MKPVPFLLIFGPILSAILVVIGAISGSIETTYLGPAIINGFLACYTSWRFIKGNDGPANLLFYAGTFLFYHFQLLTPEYWADFSQAIVEYSPESRFMSALGTSLLPLACFGVARLLERRWPVNETAGTIRGDEAVVFNDRRVFVGFLALFALVSVPNVIFGGVVASSVNSILYMRGMDEGRSVIVISDQLASILNINHFACSLVTLTWVLYRTKYRRVALLLLPLSGIWALGSIFGMGTRTQVLQFGLALLVPLIGRTSLKIRLFTLVVFGATIFVTAQIMTYYRTVGLKEVQLDEFADAIGGIQGLETMHDQTRAIEMYVEGYVSPEATGVVPLDLVIGLVYRPIELLMFPLPRSFFPWKPVDPTVLDLSRWAISRMGVDPDRFSWGITGGLLGRDTLRWGALGALVPVFWFTVLCWFADREFRRDRRSMTQLIVSGAFAGTAISMYRDLSPLWCLQLLPAAMVLIHARVGVRGRSVVAPSVIADSLKTERCGST
jgi:hypothetical protein